MAPRMQPPALLPPPSPRCWPHSSPLPVWGFALHSGLSFPTQHQCRTQGPAGLFLGSEPTCPMQCPAPSTHSPTCQHLSPAQPQVGPAMGPWGYGAMGVWGHGVMVLWGCRAVVLELTFSCRQLSILLLWSNMGAAVGAGRTPLSPRVPPCSPRPDLRP